MSDKPGKGRPTSAEDFAGRQDRSMPPGQARQASDAEAQRGNAAQAHAARDERQQSKVWTFAGDDEGHAAGEVHKLGKAGPGMSRVRPVAGGEEFVVRNDLLTGPDDDAEGQEDPAAGA